MMTSVLCDLFLNLRRRNPLLGVAELLAGLDALAAGFGDGSREEFCWMCQALWSKSLEDYDEIAEVVNKFLPKKMSAAELDKLVQQASAAVEQAVRKSPDAIPQVELPPDEPSRIATKDPVASPGRVELAPIAAAPADAPLLSRPIESAPYRSGSHFDLVGDLPVPRRYLKRAWRYVRRMQRIGPAVELDVEATAMRRYRDGVLVSPVLVPRRRNLASVLILIDEGGSMVPFRQATLALTEAAQHSGLARADVRYFHDVVGEVVFRDSQLLLASPLAEVVRPFAGSGLLIVSDGGAARGRFDTDRVAKTERFLASVRRQTLCVAWLNPVPQDRWSTTTADAVRRSGAVPMFPLDRAGLDAAIDVLRGRAE